METRYILYVSGDPEAKTDLHAQLRALDYAVVTCDSLEKANRIIHLGRPDLVLLEGSENIMDGVALLVEYLADRWPGTPLLVEEAGRPAAETVRRCCSMLGRRE